MLVLLTFVFTLAAVRVVTSERDIIIFEDEPVYRYYDAVKKCADNGHELAWPHILQKKIQSRLIQSCYDCGWTSNRYVPSRPKCGSYLNKFEDCARIPDNGVSEVGLIVYCQTADAPTDLTNQYHYNVVFVPENPDGSSMVAIGVSKAKVLCSDVGARLAYKHQLHRYERYEHCDCAWVKESRGVYKAGCTPETYTQCPYVLKQEYPVFCFGIPPLRDCKTSLSCGENETCTTVDGNFECVCSRSGYNRNAEGACVLGPDPCVGRQNAVLSGYNVECRDGMILIQHNPSCDTPNRVAFVKTWVEYANGFGTPQTGYWAGLELMHQLTSRYQFQLVIEFDDEDGVSYSAQYDNVFIGPASDEYRWHIGAFSVPAGKNSPTDALTSLDNNQQFSTIDRDNDLASFYSRSQGNGGSGWWYSAFTDANLNGLCPLDFDTYSHLRILYRLKVWKWMTSSDHSQIKIENVWMMLKRMT